MKLSEIISGLQTIMKECGDRDLFVKEYGRLLSLKELDLYTPMGKDGVPDHTKYALELIAKGEGES